MRAPISIQKLDGFVLALASGETSVESLRAIADELAKLGPSVSGEAVKVALDCGAMTGAMQVAEVFETACYYAATLRGKVRVAVFNVPAAWTHQQLGEDAVVNRGLSLKIVVNVHQAKAWLLGSR